MYKLFKMVFKINFYKTLKFYTSLHACFVVLKVLNVIYICWDFNFGEYF